MLFSCKNLEIRYDRVVRAVMGVSIDVAEGEFVSLIGSNGAGKTTILKCISGMLKPWSGEVWFQGERIDNLRPYEILRRGIAHCPEGRLIFPHLSVLDNLRMGAFIRKDKAGINADIEKMFQRFPVLKKRVKQLGQNLSGGEQMMLAIARAMMVRPKLLLMDAPSQGLAPLVIKDISYIIEDINKKDGVAILLVDQNARLCLRLASRTYLLEVGEIVLQGDSKEMANNDKVQKSYLGVD